MVKEGIVLGHVISNEGIKVDKAKVSIISNLPPLPMSRVFVLSLDMQVSIEDSFKISPRYQGPCLIC